MGNYLLEGLGEYVAWRLLPVAAGGVPLGSLLCGDEYLAHLGVESNEGVLVIGCGIILSVLQRHGYPGPGLG